jgi:IPT/TIG domain
MKTPGQFASIVIIAISGPLIAAPVITSISPTAANVGETVTINGTGFSIAPAGNKIFIGGIAVTPTTAAATQLTAGAGHRDLRWRRSAVEGELRAKKHWQRKSRTR